VDKIHAMQVFVRVAELNSFTRAAENMGLPKGSISRLVQQLENSMTTRLFSRSTRRVELTPDGQVFYQRCLEILATLDELDDLFKSTPATLNGRLRVDMPGTIATNLVLPQLPTFLNRYPALEIELSSGDYQVDLIREGFDCVLRLGEQTDPRLMIRTLGVLKMVNCASASYLERYGEPHVPDQLTQHALVHYQPFFDGQHEGFQYLVGPLPRKIKSGGTVTVNSSESYVAAGIAGLGIIQVPLIAVKPYLISRQLIEILPDYQPAPITVSLVYPQRINLSRRVKVFMDWLSDIMRDVIP
jgi:DNA-binding transcriptional LysR family regulator